MHKQIKMIHCSEKQEMLDLHNIFHEKHIIICIFYLTVFIFHLIVQVPFILQTRPSTATLHTLISLAGKWTHVGDNNENIKLKFKRTKQFNKFHNKMSSNGIKW